MSIEVDVSDLPEEVIQELIAGRQLRAVAEMEEAYKRQAQSAAEVGEHRSIDGLGRPLLNIDATSFHYWGQRESYDCWHDKAFVREFARDVPESRIIARGTRIQVGFTPAATPSDAPITRGPRWTKTYPTKL